MTTTMTLGQVRVIDPVLTNVARGFPQQMLAGLTLFPAVNVQLSGGNVIGFGREEFRLYNLRRAPGAATARVPFGYAAQSYALVQDAVEVPVPREHMRDASRQPGIELGTIATQKGMRILMLGLEQEQATLARTLGSYPAANRITLGGGARWTDTGVDPTSSIETGREAIRAAIGLYPNVAVLSAKAFAACRQNTQLLERFKYTTADSITEEMLARLWNLERVVVGKSVTVDQADVPSDVWGGDVILAYTAIGSLSAAEPTFGYTYTMEVHPLVEQAYWEANTKSWIYPVTYERVAVVAGGGAGYLIQTAVV
jgi:hypothetical protein